MIKKMLIITFMFTSLVLLFIGSSFANETDIEIILDGKNITDIAKPIIRNNRTLVPIRAISESLEAEVTWFNESRRVLIEKEDEKVLLKIDSHMTYLAKEDNYLISDIAPIIYNESTYVPLRVVSQSLKVSIDWDGEKRQVIMDSLSNEGISIDNKVKIIGLKNNDLISGTQNIKIEYDGISGSEVSEIRLLLLDPITWKGFFKEITPKLKDTISFQPSVLEEGIHLLTLAAYDDTGQLIAGDARRIKIEINPTVKIKNIKPQDVIKDTYAFESSINFIPKSIHYEITNINTQEKTKYIEKDPFGSFSWDPKTYKDGKYEIKAWVNYNDKAYYSEAIPFSLKKEKNISLLGVSSGEIIDSQTRLIAERNFDVTQTFYYIEDLETRNKELLKQVPYGSIQWTPKEEDQGRKALSVGVYDVSNQYYESAPVEIIVDFSPRVNLDGIYPGSTITKSKTLEVSSNVMLTNEEVALESNNNTVTLSKDASFKYQLNVENLEAGTYKIYGKGTYKGMSLKSEVISFNVYKGETYGPKALVEKSNFLPLVSELALDSYKKTDMSAGLQTAQAILESGWGQSVPVDKYSGQFSYNLFGIKGSGTKGSILSNTWEVYNGQVYRIDDKFRAYNSIDESWMDHKSLLLNASRYSIFREVMYDYIRGAWAIKRAGYATDPKYPIKLIRIIEEYDLKSLDSIQF